MSRKLATVRIHLDPLGGIAGDMFVGALLDMHPECAAAAITAVRQAGVEDVIGLRHIPFTDGTLSGSRFEVTIPKTDLTHQHVHWSSLKKRLAESDLSAAVGARAIDIFTHLAIAEAKVHDKAIDNVTFHEVGAWDSIADIVAAACVIESLQPCSWSIGPIPIGSGRVSTQHGLLPVPAPATVLLLDGFNCFDDGFPGERVTPTGAAIIKHLDPAYGVGAQPKRLRSNGYGFGTRRFDGMSNVLRVLEFEAVASGAIETDQVMVVRFEVDDQTPEDLALGLDRLRAIDGVIDVSQSLVNGKQGRLLSGIQILVVPEKLDALTDACFHETTTLGLRMQLTDRLILPRHEVKSNDGVRVKVAQRPTDSSAKADISDVADRDGHREREAHRAAAVSQAMAQEENDR